MTQSLDDCEWKCKIFNDQSRYVNLETDLFDVHMVKSFTLPWFLTNCAIAKSEFEIHSNWELDIGTSHN